MPTQRIQLAGHDFVLDLSGIAVWPDTRTAIVADLALADGAAGAGHLALPNFDAHDTLDRLGRTLAQYRLDRVIVLGQDEPAASDDNALDGETALLLERLTSRYRFLWLGGAHPHGHSEYGMTLRQAPDGERPLPGTAEIAGQLQPLARIRTPSKTVSSACFAFDDQRLLLPAFGHRQAGNNVLSPGICSRLSPNFRVALLGQRRLFVFARPQLEPDNSLRVD